MLLGRYRLWRRRQKTRPPTAEAALAIANRVGLKPSIVVHTGHGFHVYWLLTEELTDMAEASVLVRQWQATLAKVAVLDGWLIDSTWDLARVLRVPGTHNRKGGGALPVVMMVPGSDEEPRRYDADDIRSWSTADVPESSDRQSGVGFLELRPDAALESDLLDRLRDADPKFNRTWRRERRDLKDQSASAYDLALAHLAILAGLTDQQTADLLIQYRRKHGDQVEKSLRRDYMERTIGAARKAQETATALTSLENLAPPPQEPTVPVECSSGDVKGVHGDSEANVAWAKHRAKVLEVLSAALRVEITGWIQHGTEEVNYALELADGREVAMGTRATATNQQEFRNRLWEATGRRPPRLKGASWDKLLEQLASIATVVANPEAGGRPGSKDG